MSTEREAIESTGATTVPVQVLIRHRIEIEPEFAGLLLQGAIENLLKNEVTTAQLMLRDITNCTVGFKALADSTGIMEKSLMRMLSAKGNPQARNLFRIIHALQQLNGLSLEISAAAGVQQLK